MTYTPDDPTISLPEYKLWDPDPTAHLPRGHWCGSSFNEPGAQGNEGSWVCTRESGHAGNLHFAGTAMAINQQSDSIHMDPFIAAIWVGNAVTEEEVRAQGQAANNAWHDAHPHATTDNGGLARLLAEVLGSLPGSVAEALAHREHPENPNEASKRMRAGFLLPLVGENGLMDDVPEDTDPAIIEHAIDATRIGRIGHGVCPAIMLGPGRRFPYLCTQRLHSSGDHVAYDAEGEVAARWNIDGDPRSLIVSDREVGQGTSQDWDAMLHDLSSRVGDDDEDRSDD